MVTAEAFYIGVVFVFDPRRKYFKTTQENTNPFAARPTPITYVPTTRNFDQPTQLVNHHCSNRYMRRIRIGTTRVNIQIANNIHLII